MFTYTVDDELELRILEERHAEDLFNLTEANRNYLNEWLMWADDIRSVADSRQFIRDGLRQFAENDGFQAGIWQYGDLVGCIGFHRINWYDRNTEIGYWLAKACAGKGVMTRSCKVMMDHAFSVWHLHRVVIRCAAGNLKSRAIPERLGFTLDGVMRHEICIHGKYHDHVVYSILTDEWLQQQNWQRRSSKNKTD
ncbi:MAG TPA: GNAT family protein [Phototrophicaceae bacterium]|jgi:ribosomal-protein-serine acetyltransferase|nr:GNAT family protein [Phototrophicaceae bacterium]